jgi:AraC-like DNA-binding protein
MPSSRNPDDPLLAKGAAPLSDDLRRVLRTELLKDTCSAAEVARLFSMHRRTLNRHLSTEGLAFRRIADQVRFEIACELMMKTDMALGQIAAVLRYSELSAFTRAFRRWSGQTPSAWRRIRVPSRGAQAADLPSQPILVDVAQATLGSDETAAQPANGRSDA